MRKKLLTTGNVAAMLGVSPKTVLFWCRTAALPHWRLPGGSRDRRIEPNALAAYLRAKEVPLPAELSAMLRGLVVGATSVTRAAILQCTDAVDFADDALEAGAALAQPYAWLIVDGYSGLAPLIATKYPDALVIVGEDDERTYTNAVRHPVSVVAIQQYIDARIK